MNFILDGVLLLFIVIFVMASARRGFLSASKNILALVLTAIMLATLQSSILTLLQSTPISTAVRTSVEKNITKTYEEKEISQDIDTSDQEGALVVYDALAFPKFMENSIKTTVSSMTQIKNNLLDVIAESITTMILKVIGMILVFLFVKIFVFLIIKGLEGLFKLPGLKTVNRLLGGAIGIINALLVIYIVCGAISLFAPTDKLAMINEAIGSTYLLKHFYDSNLLLSLFV